MGVGVQICVQIMEVLYNRDLDNQGFTIVLSKC